MLQLKILIKIRFWKTINTESNTNMKKHEQKKKKIKPQM